MTSEGGKNLTPQDALAYLHTIKNTFKDNREKYNTFLRMMKDYKEKRFDQVVPSVPHSLPTPRIFFP